MVKKQTREKKESGVTRPFYYLLTLKIKTKIKKRDKGQTASAQGFRTFGYNANIASAQDYYPYGMGATTPLGSTSLTSTTSSTTVYGQTGGLQIDIPVTAGVPIDISTTISYIYGSFLSVSLSEAGSGGTTKILASTNTNLPGTLTMPITPATTSVRLKVMMMSSYITPPSGGLFSISDAAYEKITYTAQNVLVTLCNKGLDKYEFGFNTQMKMNEVAGVGNWNTAEFWEYNTRTARRANLDPKPQISMSDYSVMGGNPIVNSDVLGDRYTHPNTTWKRLVNDITGNSFINRAYDYYKQQLKSRYAEFTVSGDEATVTTDHGQYYEHKQRGWNQKTMHFSEKKDYRSYSESSKYVSANILNAHITRQSPNQFIFTDPFCVSTGGLSYVKVVKDGVQYTKSSFKIGQEMHKAYKLGEEGIKEFRLPSGRRIDFLDLKNK